MGIPQRMLGRTGLSVSALSVGTVALGISYGIRDADGQPSREDGIALLRLAADAGINLFDTAPNYGAAESVLGAALGNRPDTIFATKVTLPSDGARWSAAELRAAIDRSIDNSRRALRRDVIDIVQVHNLSIEHAASPLIVEAMESIRSAGKVRFLGASVYTEDEALTALHSGWVDVLQVAYNMLDQRMASHVFAEAASLNIGVLTRSAFLKGALTPRVRLLPAELDTLRGAVEDLASALALPLEAMPRAALEFCIGEARISSVLIGPSKLSELEQAIETVDYGRATATHALGVPHALNNPALVDPRLWPLP
jgi:aryl-alcohol dehydrogenase-like predicted oxidoreductase